MREQARNKLRSFSQSTAWSGLAGWRRGLFTLVFASIRVWLGLWLWGTGLRLAHFPTPTKTVGAILAMVAAALVIWGVWGLVKSIRLLGLKRSVTLVLVFLAIIVGFDILTLPSDQPRASALLRQLYTRVAGIGSLGSGIVSAVVGAPGEFSFAYNGTRRPPSLPAGFPTPDPQATPVQAVARRAGQALPLAPVAEEATTPEPNEPVQLDTRLHVGGYARVVNTDGKALQARVEPGTSANVVARFAQGTRLAIIGGPESSNGYIWWQVRSDQGQEGWCADTWLESAN